MEEETITELDKTYKFYQTLANFHQKRATDETYNPKYRNFHLTKMKHYDTLCGTISDKITAKYTQKKLNANDATRSKINL